MSVFEIDLTKVGVIPDGTYVGIIQSAEVKISKEGSQYINWGIFIPEHSQLVYYMTSLKTTALFGIKKLLESAGVPFTTSGFDTDAALNKQISVTISIIEDATYGTQSKITKVGKA